MIEDVGRQHQFVRTVALDEVGDAPAHRIAAADDGAGQCLGHAGLLVRLPERFDVIDRRRHQAGPAAPQVDERLLLGGEQVACLLVGLGRHDIQGQHRMRPGQPLRRAEIAVVQQQRLVHRIGREMGSERVRQPQGGGQLRAEQARAQQPHGHVETCTGHSTHRLALLHRLEIAQHLLHVLRKLLGAVEIAPQRTRRRLVGAWRTAQAQIDAARIQRRQRAELLGYLQR